MNSKVLILSGDGINCEQETIQAFEGANFTCEKKMLSSLIHSPELIFEFDVIAFPGGFSFGDEIHSGQVMAMALKSRFHASLKEFIQRKKLILGICNGFQILMKLGLFEEGERKLTLTHNDSHEFIDQWELMNTQESNCIWTQGLAQTCFMPIRHGEGKVWSANPQAANELKDNKQIVLTYQRNPNGSLADIAGLCDKSGQIFGLMPHPEAALKEKLYPDFNPTYLHNNLKIFSNAQKFLQENR